MAPLVGYDSSDDEEEVQQVETLAQETEAAEDAPPVVAQDESSMAEAMPTPPPGPSLPPDAASIGPSLPPADATEGPDYPEEMDQDVFTPHGDPQAPASPYTANRTLIHNLTLPTVPNLDIPPSPPSSPSQSTSQAALTAKFDKFLELKRSKGTHFNAKIADSHALKNPPLMDKLLGFVGVSTSFVEGAVEGTEQYATTLDKELWDPACFPEWAYRGPLRKAQEQTQKEKGRARGEAVQFIPAS